MRSYIIKKGIWSILLLMFSVLTFSTLSSCKKDSNGDTGMNDNYYVKYQIIGNGAYGRFSNWTATTPQGAYSNNGYQTPSWNQTFGPIKKGFRCEVKIGSYIGGTPTIEIHASKNQEPFALKVSTMGSSASYTVNF